MSVRPAGKPVAATLPGVTTETPRGTETSAKPSRSSSTGNDESQLAKVNALARAREEGARESAIATMCECAAMAHQLVVTWPDNNTCAIGVRDAILAELRRRYGADDPRVRHHLRMRGLACGPGLGRVKP